MPRPDKASVAVLYQESVLPEHPMEECPQTAIMTYAYDLDNWIEVTVGERGIEIRTNGANMMVSPLSGNNIEVYLRDRK